ncbi:hypothetical protein [Cytobacillus horneckiae]|uniref:hypothetical protein n=1 Tax=Cytobacillus horneckiae TaxID=549687 RepID=UPI003D9A8267
MANRGKLNKAQLPEGYDPYDVDLKKQIHERADQKNFIQPRGNSVVLRCGAKKKKKEDVCRQLAGFGTDHPGFGRCKFCGGSNTGPKTAAGKAAAAANSRKHGFYSKVLTPEERDTYEELLEDKRIGLEDEIHMMKAKILSYLARYNRKAKAGYAATLEWYKEGDEAAYFHAGTIEDRTLTRALETLRRLVDSHAKLTGNDSGNILDQINAELRVASQKESSESWGGPAQQRKETSS